MTQEQLNKLDKCYFSYSLDDKCIEDIIDARTLLGTYRFDLYAILFYIDQKVKGVFDLSFAKKVYKERTRAMTGFRLSEIGNDNKSSFDDFIHVLDQLILDFQNDSYDFEKTLIPIDNKGELIDGAHRVSCAAYFNKKIKVLRFLEREVTPYDYNYVQQELFSSEITDIMALEALNWHDNIYALFFWPQAHKYKDKLHTSLALVSKHAEILYQTEYKLTFQAIKNLMIQIYGHMSWIGTVDNGYKNIIGKVDEVWADNEKLRIVLIRANNCEDVLLLKTMVRDLYNMGYAPIHSTDNICETLIAMNALLNPNSRHHLLNGDVTRYKESYKLFSRFKNMLDQAGLNKKDFIIDSSMVLSIYGLRPARDLDYYSLHSSQTLQYPTDIDIEEHDDTQKMFYPMSMQDLINNPKNYFVFNGIKFVTLQNLLIFKQLRYKKIHETKDFDDIKLIHSVLSNQNKLAKFLSRLRLVFKRKKRVFNQIIFAKMITISKKVHLYESLRIIKSALSANKHDMRL